MEPKREAKNRDPKALIPKTGALTTQLGSGVCFTMIPSKLKNSIS